MKTNDSVKDSPGVLGMFIVTLSVIAALMILFGCGCTRKVYVPEERVVLRTDTVFSRSETQRVDTVWRVSDTSLLIKDSVAVRTDSLNRVVGYDWYHFRDLTKKDDTRLITLQTMVDSLKQIKADSVVIREPYPVETVREVNRLRWWQRILMDVGACAIIILAFIIIQRFKQRKKI